MAFSLNSLTALHLIDQRLLDGYKKHATYNADRRKDGVFYSMRDEKGEWMGEVRDVWFSERSKGLGMRTRSCIHRARLLEELVGLLPEGVTSFNKAFVHSEYLDDGTIRLHFADKSTVLCSAILGCDGIKSRVRARVCPDVKPTYAKETAYRAVVPRADVIAALGEDKAMNGQIYCGSNAYVITYPISKGELVNMAGFPYRPSDEHSPDSKEDGWEWTLPASADEIKESFKGWYEPLVDVFSAHHLPTKWAMYVLSHESPYYAGRTCLVGDAAHATVPHLGAGAGMAMEDAYILSSLIAAVGNVADIERAFKAYDSVRRPRTQECVRRSLEASVAYGGRINDGREMKGVLEESFKWLWGVDLEGELARGKKLLGLKTETGDSPEGAGER